MTKSPQIPYNMPDTLEGKVNYLARLVKLNQNFVNRLGNEKALEILTGIVLYHHLGRLEQFRFMETISRLPRDIYGAIVPKVTDPLVSQYWGLWSKSTDNLAQQREYLDKINSWAGLFGVTFSAPSAYSTIKEASKGGASLKPKANVMLMAVIWGFFWLNTNSQNAIEDELIRRSQSFK